MNITFIAPPAAGKGVLSKKIYEKYGFPHVSIGNLLRDVKDEKVKKMLKEGKFVSNEIVADLLYKRLSEDDCQKGFILDGFPRNKSQISIYENICHNGLNNIIIVMDIPKEIGQKRITGRRVCPKCGNVYNVNVLENKPKKDNICDDCGHELIKRTDDDLSTYDQRYDLYINETAPILDYYKNSKNIYHVDATKNIDDVFADIEKIIEVNL